MNKSFRSEETSLMLASQKRRVAYFSMEIGIRQEIRTYSGGLGILAGDTIRSAADLEVPMVAVTLLYRKGYLRQRLNSDGWQVEEPDEWVVQQHLKELPNRISLRVEGRYVYVRAWRYEVEGITGYKVPIFFLDADLPENAESDRTLTHFLYGGDEYYRLAQEKILGIGGLRMLRNLGYLDIERYHMNEGHASLLTLELLDIEAWKQGREGIHPDDAEGVRSQCVFTTHTPVPAGHDKFSMDLANRIMQRSDLDRLKDIFYCDGMLNLTNVAMGLSRYVNGVAKKHGEVSRSMFQDFHIDSITNGVHADFWTSEPLKKVFDERIPGWRKDNFELRYALNIPREKIHTAHQASKRRMIDHIRQMTGVELKEDVLTIGSARRATPYKRGDLLFRDLNRLKDIVRRCGSLQLVFGGKSHPRDHAGKEIIQRISRLSREIKEDQLKLVYLPDYDIELAKVIIPGVDLWLNTPERPLEASGTSGMKAAMNGVPSLSVLDGWWIEGHIEGITGWSIGQHHDHVSSPSNTDDDANSLYEKLEKTILPLYYQKRDYFDHVMRNSIALNGAFFNTQRMMQEYVLKAYYL